MANTELQRTQSGTETDSKKATISVWLKLSAVEGNYAMGVFGSHVSGDYSANGNAQIGFFNGGLYAWWKTGDSSYYKQESTRRFRDTNAWYHVVYRYDTTQSSGDDRIRVYVNGEEITSWVAVNDPPQNANIEINNGGRIIRVGTYNYLSGTPNYFNGSMSHYHFCDGYSYAPTEFGSTDSTTGEWKINTSPSVSYGTNGFLILKDGNTITDSSPNSNNFSLGGGTLTKTKDCPSNVFATLNPLIAVNGSSTYIHGNTKVESTSGSWSASAGTLGFTKGKFYWEIKGINEAQSMFGVGEASINMNDANPQDLTGTTLFYNNAGGEMRKDGSNTSADYGTFSSTDVMGIACNMDDKEITIYKNGSAIVTNYSLSTSIVTCIPFNSLLDSGAIGIFNFGNGYFGNTAVSSAGTNASGNGIFEYDVPTGYTALSTKGLNL